MRDSNQRFILLICTAMLSVPIIGCSSGSSEPADRSPHALTVEDDAGPGDVVDAEVTLDLERPAADPVAFTAREMVDSFSKDRNAFVDQYQGQRLEFTAKVETFLVEKPHSSSPDITIVVSPVKESDGFDLNAMIECFPSDPNPWNKANIGSPVTMRGTLMDRRYGLFFQDCEVVSAEGTPPAQFTAAELTKLYYGEDTGQKLYDEQHDRTVIVSGEVGRAMIEGEKADLFKVNLTLKGVDDTEVAIHYTVRGKDGFKNVRAGDSVRLIGTCVLSESTGDHSFYLLDSVRLPDK